MENLSSESAKIRDGRVLAGVALTGLLISGLGAVLYAADSGLGSSPGPDTKMLTQVSAPFREGVYISAEAAGIILASGAAIAAATGRRQEQGE